MAPLFCKRSDATRYIFHHQGLHRYNLSLFCACRSKPTYLRLRQIVTIQHGEIKLKSGFLDKLIERMDKLDPQSIQLHFLKLSRERGLLETIFQSIQEGVLVIDGEGRLNYANRAAESMIGFTFDAARGRPVSNFFREIDWDWDLILRCDDSEWSKLVSKEIEITYPEHRILSFYVVPLSGPEGEQEGAVMMLRDVTRDREQEADLVESERLNAVKLLAAGVAHEIGNPLNALHIHLQLLEREIRELDTERADELHELVNIANNEVSRLDVIITQFLRAIRPAKPDPTDTAVDDLLRQTLNLLREEISNRSVDVQLSIPESVPPIKVDRDQMKQAFFNVIRNAIQAMPDGGALEITISSSDTFQAITFRDSGVGIAAEDLARIFEPYHTTKTEGSGLGMMIVQRIVQDHGGQIEVRSKPETGTAITILLPRYDRRTRLLQSPESASSNNA